MTAFRLATVERLREQQLQVRAQELHQATRALEQAVGVREALIARLRDAAPVVTSSPDELLRDSMYRERLRGDLLQGATEIVRLGGILGERRTAWLHAHTQYRAITALHERHRLVRRTAVARQEQIELDEVAGNRRIIALGSESGPGSHHDLDDLDHLDDLGHRHDLDDRHDRRDREDRDAEMSEPSPAPTAAIDALGVTS